MGSHAEYHITQVSAKHYKVAKFEGAPEPSNIYFVTIVRKGDKGFNKDSTDPQMHCDCPNRRRGKHINDKHGQMVARWIVDHRKKPGYFTQSHEFIELETYHDDPNWLNDPGEPGADDPEAYPDDEVREGDEKQG